VKDRVPQPGNYAPAAPANGRVDPGQQVFGEAPAKRGRPGRNLVWVLVILVAALAGAAVFASGRGPGQPVLVTTHALAAGDIVQASDLTVDNVKAPGTSTIDGSRMVAVVGERATGPLAAGTILSPSSVTAAPQVANDQVGIALALNPDQAAQGILVVGRSVLIVGQLATSGSGQVTAVAAPATVLAISAGAANSGKVLVDLALTNPTDAVNVSAAMASAQGVRLIVLSQAAANG
jgi:hypothetical protein